MLRGVNKSSVPDTGTRFIDIPKSRLFQVVKDASCDMFSADGVLARDQVLADMSGRFSVRERADSGSGNRRHLHDSQSLILCANQERFTQAAFPCPPGRGPIEGLLVLGLQPVLDLRFPCPPGRGPIEGLRDGGCGGLRGLFPCPPGRGPIEGSSLRRRRRFRRNISVPPGARPH